jgi:CelD/BcsL family acetyltransferase involved in cellulose biosynthesis
LSDIAFERYDMLAPHDAYKSEWADDAAPVADYVVGFTTRGRIFARVVWPLARKALRNRALFNGQDRARDQGVTSSPSRFPESAS